MPRARPAGFTLIEVIVVLAILGIVGGLVLTHSPQRSGAMEMRQATSLLAGTLRQARGRAIASNRPIPVRLDPAAATVQLGADPARRLPAGIAFASGPRLMLFRPDGGASGGEIGLVLGSRKAVVAVDWLTGRVAVGAGS